MSNSLWIDPNVSLSTAGFAAALIDLGAPQDGMIRAIKSAIEGQGLLDAHTIITEPLDLFDGTLILDIKPFIHTLDGGVDGREARNDGWLEGSYHLELHRLGIPHEHPASLGGILQAQILIAVLNDIAWGLQQLDVDLGSVVCASPVCADPEYALKPTAKAVCEQNKIPYQFGPETGEPVSSAGAAILAALEPEFAPSDHIPLDSKRAGLGLGEQILDTASSFCTLLLFLFESSHWR